MSDPPATPASPAFRFVIAPGEVPTLPVTPGRSTAGRSPAAPTNLSPSPMDISPTPPVAAPRRSGTGRPSPMNLSPTVPVAAEWQRVTGRAAPHRDDQMLHEGVTDNVQNIQESRDGVDDPFRPRSVVIVDVEDAHARSPSLASTLSSLPSSVRLPSSSSIPSVFSFGPKIEPFHPDLLSRPLIPFGKFDGAVRNRIRTLLDLVWAALPLSPAIYDRKQLKGTRGPTASEYLIPPSKSLEKVVYCGEMLAPIEPEVAAILHAIPIDWNNDVHMLFAARVFPWLTSLDCPKRIYSEVDTEDWIRETLMGPAHAVIHAVLLGRIPEDANPMYPFHSSAHNRFHNRPDDVTTLRGEHPHETVSHVGEWKTKAVIPIIGNPLQLIARPILGVTNPGAAIRFNWPKSPSSLFAERDKILCQIWCQLMEWDVFCGTLSSMDVTTFYMRSRYDDNALYVSKFNTTETDSPTLFRMVCWLLVSMEYKGMLLDVPAARNDWWTPEIRNDRNPGMVERMLMDLPVVR